MTVFLDMTKWKELLQLAESGNSEAQFKVADCYDSGLENEGVEIVKEDKEQAFKWFFKSHENGNIEGTIRIADFLSEGECCEKNIQLAIELYKKGIDKGYGYAAINLATVYRDNNEFETAVEYYQIAQNLEKTDSIELAYCYHFGIGIKKDRLKAFEIFQKIANDNSEFRNCEYDIEEANYYLGLYYLEGEIVEKSIAKGREFLMKANEDNDHRCANELLLIIGKTE